jgi:hypothetical protein
MIQFGRIIPITTKYDEDSSKGLGKAFSKIAQMPTSILPSKTEKKLREFILKNPQVLSGVDDYIPGQFTILKIRGDNKDPLLLTGKDHTAFQTRIKNIFNDCDEDEFPVLGLLDFLKSFPNYIDAAKGKLVAVLGGKTKLGNGKEIVKIDYLPEEPIDPAIWN